MFNITFYQYNKKENSTARPSMGGAVFQCVLKEPTSIVNPDIILQFDFTTVPKFNYCYIAEFERYYFVSNWTALNGGRWLASLRCDVLATYKNVIGGISFLIERASADYDGFLTDNLYPASQERNETVLVIDPTTAGSWSSMTIPHVLTNGYFIVSVINGDQSGYSYYCMTYNEFKSFKSALYDSINWYDAGDIADGLKKSIADPFQYINSITWFPVKPWTTPTKEEVNFGFWPSGVSAWKLSDECYTVESMTINNSRFSQHPQASTRGQYLNCNPYTRLTAVMNPWGSFDIDPSFIAQGLNLKLSLRIDYITGGGLLKAESVTSGGAVKELLYMSNAMFGVPIPVTQRAVNMSGIGDALSGIFSGNPFQAIGAVIGGALTTAVDTANPTVKNKGANGSLASLTDDYKFYQTHFLLTDEDNTRNGRPLMQNRTPAELGGYMSVVDPSFTGMIGTDTEREQLKALMRGGFYYE